MSKKRQCLLFPFVRWQRSKAKGERTGTYRTYGVSDIKEPIRGRILSPGDWIEGVSRG
jgi:hypothetical protein